MASTPSTNQTIHGDDNTDVSYFQKTVCLNDWWLIKAENEVQGKWLAVAGVSSRKEGARRVFSSAPIAKRFDVFTLETVDGICVAIKGFINKQKTTENGFPSEVFSHFLFGFPPYWEQWVAKFFGGDSTTTCAVSGSISDSDKLATQPGSIKSSIPSSLHFDQEETPVERVSCEDRHDVEVPKQFSSELPTNVAVDDFPKHAAEEETGRANIGASDFQCIGKPMHLVSNQKKPVSRCFMKHKSTNSSPASEASESLGGVSGATTQSGGKVDISEEYASYSAGRVTRSLSRNLSRKGKKKKMVGCGLNSEKNTVDSVPAVFKTLSKSLQNDNSKVGGKSMSHPSDFEFQEPNDLKVKKKLDFGCLEDDLQHTHNAKQGQNCGNITTQVGGESDAKEENTFRKRTKTNTTFYTKENPTLEVNKKVSIASPESLNMRRSRSGRLLLPTMEFWRNQLAIYDSDRKVTGIQGGLPIVTTSRGISSGSQKRNRR
ncbi:PREDICTED: EMBRYO DEFECTIVE 1674 [Prunus dulcis]|uniref:PREDICTED: EMBRYO DEFECTIVE 1674 n=1 Tax=Prunus dulcis TaxID=3755 RepID=A0A5E4F3C4_PRUDU|nr:kinetochore-associated protein KNL-2 homolog isoform X1 [Prunus dulcis]XP_034221098.1 kinetochore-associated protein KNL-2 homolog isoform X1 [Prunus dulcis]XP_034221100.1 kinetochore-associated protein KNL-2 homolog isoform X1 [Prunus dulcis]VVA22604.1 PREDICTED: EMBRYO DEFECTIVE 1674 [Prunus dulcis]